MGKAGKRGRKKRVKKVSEPVAGPGEGPADVGRAGAGGRDDGAGGVSGDQLRASDFAGRVDPGVVGVVQWVFEHLDLAGTEPGEAPSAGAWSQLLWARGERDKFMVLWGKTCASAKQLAAAEDDQDDGAELFGLLDKLAKVRSEAIGRARAEVGRG